MKYIAFILILIISGHFLIASDTTYYANGQIHTIVKKNKIEITYYQNGNLKMLYKPDQIIRKGKVINYDSLGFLTSKGKIILNQFDHGTWKFYENKKIIRKEKYKWGLTEKEYTDNNGDRVLFILQYGLIAYREPCKEAQKRFGIKYILVAGCVVNPKIKFKVRRYYFLNHYKLIRKHGDNWYSEMMQFCSDLNPT
ncbi:MAG: hypothetical protein HN704_05340 [Bacteroidetes bacterium]|jgi:hypothetical protein|nr:hypothetical protein [Bacteroidota bacterium]MBT6685056.1 hypothetical protein [Bacteroidota bacterium]MBT7143195.1 hypothetical protein [Bacteroidota bacterium]MBT7491017.1 hypothetical protein [Bacteroidota bacterium]